MTQMQELDRQAELRLHLETRCTADRIKRLRTLILELKNTKEEQDAAYFFSCGISRLEVHLKNQRKAYYDNAQAKLRESDDADHEQV